MLLLLVQLTAPSVVVNISGVGAVRGTALSEGTAEFLSIPYAAPPTGGLRFLPLRCLGILPCRLTHRRQHFSQPQDLPRTIIRATTRARATIRLLSGRQTVLWMEIKGSRLVGSWLRLPSLRSYMFAIPSPSSAPISHGQRSLIIRARACVQQTGSSWQM